MIYKINRLHLVLKIKSHHYYNKKDHIDVINHHLYFQIQLYEYLMFLSF